jgi:hypothetical protein
MSSYTNTNHQTYALHIYNHTVFSVKILDKNFNISAIYKTVIITNMQPIFIDIMTVQRTSSHNENGHYITTVSLTSKLILKMEQIWISGMTWRKCRWQWKLLLMNTVMTLKQQSYLHNACPSFMLNSILSSTMCSPHWSDRFGHLQYTDSYNILINKQMKIISLRVCDTDVSMRWNVH